MLKLYQRMSFLTHAIFQIFWWANSANSANSANFTDFLRKPRLHHRQTMARLSANLQISRLAVYNTYIPQTGNYEFAAFLEVKSRICKKFAVIGKKICRICRFCRTLRKFFHQFLEFYGGAGDPSTAQKYDFLSVFSTSVLVRLNPYRWGRPMLLST